MYFVTSSVQSWSDFLRGREIEKDAFGSKNDVDKLEIQPEKMDKCNIFHLRNNQLHKYK